jgi:hypothetical protein
MVYLFVDAIAEQLRLGLSGERCWWPGALQRKARRSCCTSLQGPLPLFV